MRHPRHSIAVALALAVSVLGGCGSNESTASTPSTSTAATSTDGRPSTTGTPTGLPIPDSAAIDAITEDLTKPASFDLTAKCNAFATTFRANDLTGAKETAVMAALNELAGVVRPIDPAVAAALAGHPGAAAAWCKAKGMTNI